MQTITKYIYTIILLSLLCICGARADSLRVSVLTCAPGPDAYAHFGHTALRITNFDTQKDIVFNYGCFDYTGSMFVYKFIKGETDYLLGAERLDFFLWRYQMMGIQVDEQVLNISQQEAANLARLLSINLLPENVEYRYNYLYDNCTTRARDMIETAITEEIVYQKEPIALTAREELHESLGKADWLRFGIDLVLGQKLDDKDFDKRHQMFIPSHYEAELDSAFKVSEDGKRESLISEKYVILEANPNAVEQPTSITPMMLFCILFLIAGYFSIRNWANRKQTFIIDIILSGLQGVAGIIVSFLFFFSEHPTVDSNWLVIIFNPLYLAYAAYLTYCMQKKKQNILASAIMAVYVVFFVIMIVVRQSFDTETYILAFTLLLRAISVYMTEERIKRKNKKLSNQ